MLRDNVGQRFVFYVAYRILVVSRSQRAAGPRSPTLRVATPTMRRTIQERSCRTTSACLPPRPWRMMRAMKRAARQRTRRPRIATTATRHASRRHRCCHRHQPRLPRLQCRHRWSRGSKAMEAATVCSEEIASWVLSGSHGQNTRRQHYTCLVVCICF